MDLLALALLPHRSGLNTILHWYKNQKLARAGCLHFARNVPSERKRFYGDLVNVMICMEFNVLYPPAARACWMLLFIRCNTSHLPTRRLHGVSNRSKTGDSVSFLPGVFSPLGDDVCLRKLRSFLRKLFFSFIVFRSEPFDWHLTRSSKVEKKTLGWSFWRLTIRSSIQQDNLATSDIVSEVEDGEVDVPLTRISTTAQQGDWYPRRDLDGLYGSISVP